MNTTKAHPPCNEWLNYHCYMWYSTWYPLAVSIPTTKIKYKHNNKIAKFTWTKKGTEIIYKIHITMWFNAHICITSTLEIFKFFTKKQDLKIVQNYYNYYVSKSNNGISACSHYLSNAWFVLCCQTENKKYL